MIHVLKTKGRKKGRRKKKNQKKKKKKKKVSRHQNALMFSSKIFCITEKELRIEKKVSLYV